jgi:hypothetical protein
MHIRFQVFHGANLNYFHSAIFGISVIEGGFTDHMFTAYVLEGSASFM